MSRLQQLLARAASAAAPGLPARRLARVARLVAAAILAQTLFFKLTYAPETRVIFGDIGGRPAATFAALVELACVVLLLRRSTAGLGGLLALGTMTGAVATHLLLVGVVIADPVTGQGDGGLLFGLALVTAAASAFVAWTERGASARTALRLLPEPGSV
jgi:hypothetical protein